MSVILDRSYLFLFAGFIAFAPIPLGGNHSAAWTFSAFFICFLTLWFAVSLAIGRQYLPFPMKRLRIALIFFVLVCVWVFIQIQSFLPEVLHHPLWWETKQLLGPSVQGSISINPIETETHLMRLVMYGMVFVLALQLGSDLKRAEFILKCIAFATLCNVFYALILWSLGSDTILWFKKWAGEGDVSGTFVNRNHFAAYLCIGCLIWASYCSRGIFKIFLQSRGMKLVYAIEKIFGSFSGRNGLFLLALLFVVGTVFLTRSRAGLMCTALALFSLTFLIASGRSFMSLSSRGERQPGFVYYIRYCVLGLTLIGILTLMYSMAGERLAARLVAHGVVDLPRMNVFYQTLQAIGDSFWLGTGFGTFADVFPFYRNDTISPYGRWLQAHNSYLEAVLELGLPAALLFFSAIGLCFLTCLRGALTRRKDEHFAQIAVAVSIGLFAHSMVDFPLQIPGITITYAALLGLGCAQSWSSRV